MERIGRLKESKFRGRRGSRKYELSDLKSLVILLDNEPLKGRASYHWEHYGQEERSSVE